MSSTFGRGALHGDGESSATSAANLEWMCASCSSAAAGRRRRSRSCDALVAAVAPAPTIRSIHPFLYGSRQDGTARAGFYGIAGWHGEGHMLRALFEGVAFAHRRHVETLREAGVPFDRPCCRAAARAAPVWPQMFADVLGVPVTVARSARDRRAGRRDGRRRSAPGDIADLAEAAGRDGRAPALLQPDPAIAAIYERRYRNSGRRIDRGHAPLWAALASPAPIAHVDGHYDYIIVGAASAGCVLANRLSANPGNRVLLLEAGGRDRYLWIHVPVGYLYCMGNPRTDWMIGPSGAGLNGRSLAYPRGKVLGGCSSINGMIYMRGQAADYDGWRAARAMPEPQQVVLGESEAADGRFGF